MTVEPIIVIEDDEDDRLFIQQAIEACGVEYPILFFHNGAEGLAYLKETSDRPFVIFCDINMPVMDGIELRRHINESEYLRTKSIPFVFLTTTSDPKQVKTAYKLTIQGFFQKPNDLSSLQKRIQQILNYWQNCLHPNKL